MCLHCRLWRKMKEVARISSHAFSAWIWLPVQGDGFAGLFLTRCCTVLCSSPDLDMLPISWQKSPSPCPSAEILSVANRLLLPLFKTRAVHQQFIFLAVEVEVKHHGPAASASVAQCHGSRITTANKGNVSGCQLKRTLRASVWR